MTPSDSEETPERPFKKSIEKINDKYGDVLKKLSESERKEKEGAD